MTADEARLELGPQLGRDVPGGQRAEAGRDAVVGLGLMGERVDDLTAAPDRRQRLRGEMDLGAAAGDSATSSAVSGPAPTVTACPRLRTRS